MAHFARVSNNIVIKVHVLNNAVITNDEGVEHEDWGQQFLADLHGFEPTEFIQCSYNGNFRGMYPGPGCVWDPELDEFLPPVSDSLEE
jgi:hypothetical protein